MRNAVIGAVVVVVASGVAWAGNGYVERFESDSAGWFSFQDSPYVASTQDSWIATGGNPGSDGRDSSDEIYSGSTLILTAQRAGDFDINGIINTHTYT